MAETTKPRLPRRPVYQQLLDGGRTRKIIEYLISLDGDGSGELPDLTALESRVTVLEDKVENIEIDASAAIQPIPNDEIAALFM